MIWRIPVELRNVNFPSSMVNVWHARTNIADDVDAGTTAADNPIDALHAFYTTLMPDFAAGTIVSFPESVVEVSTQEEKNIQKPAEMTTTSTNTAPKGLSYCVSWKTSIRARRARGRTFIGPLGLAFDTGSGGVPSVNFKTRVTTACTDLLAASSGVNGWALGVYGQENAGVAEPKILRDFTAFSLPNEFSLLRSRRD